MDLSQADSGQGDTHTAVQHLSSEAGIVLPDIVPARLYGKDKILPPCRVCGNEASGFHYGCNTCEACKGFFRRALTRPASFRCKGSGKCTITGDKRNVCAACRYQRCLSLGMSKEAIKTGRYTHEKRTRDTLEVRELKEPIAEQEVSAFDRPTSENHTTDLNSYEVHDTETRVMQEDDVTARVTRAARKTQFLSSSHGSLQDMMYLRLASENKLLANGEASFQQFLNEAQCESIQTSFEHFISEAHRVTEVAPLELYVTDACDDSDNSQQDVEAPVTAPLLFHVTKVCRIMRNYIQFGRSVPGFCSLCLTDQGALFRSAWVEISLLGNAFSGNFLPDHADKIGIRNDACTSDLQSRIELTLGRIRRLSLTSQELALTQAMCLTFTDRGNLEEKNKVEAIHWLVVRCLLNRLKRNHGSLGGQKFSEIISMLTSLRDITQEVEQLKKGRQEVPAETKR